MNTCTNGSATPLVERGTTLGVVPMGPREKHPLPWPEVAAPRESPHSCGDPDRNDQQAADGHQARRPEREGKAEHGDHGEREPGARRHRRHREVRPESWRSAGRKGATAVPAPPVSCSCPPRSAPRRTGRTCVHTPRKGRPPPPPSTSPRRPPPARYGRTAPGRVPTPHSPGPRPPGQRSVVDLACVCAPCMSWRSAVAVSNRGRARADVDAPVQDAVGVGCPPRWPGCSR